MTDFESQLLMELHAIREALEKIAGNSSSNATANPLAQSVISPQTAPLSSPSTQSSPMTTTQPLPSGGPVQRYYFGTPDGNGFEECNAMNDPDSIRILYVIETKDGKFGRFYPLERSMQRLKSNAQAFLLPLCNISKSLDELGAETITREQYGEVELENGFWKVTRKCSL